MFISLSLLLKRVSQTFFVFASRRSYVARPSFVCRPESSPVRSETPLAWGSPLLPHATPSPSLPHVPPQPATPSGSALAHHTHAPSPSPSALPSPSSPPCPRAAVPRAYLDPDIDEDLWEDLDALRRSFHPVRG